ncbi:hypothetical protein ACW5EG_00925 [Luteimonas sp. A611]
MATRLKLYSWTLSKGLFARFSSSLLQDSYADAAGSGFIVESARPDEVRGVFLQKVIYADDVLSSDGTFVTVDRVGFQRTKFIAAPGHGGLVLLDAPRKTSDFLMRVSQHAQYEVAISQCSIDLKRVKKVLEGGFGRADVRSVRLSDVRIDTDASAEVGLTDKSDALRKADEVFANFQRTLSRIDMVFRDQRNLKIVVTRSGSVVLQNISNDAIGKAITLLKHAVV